MGTIKIEIEGFHCDKKEVIFRATDNSHSQVIAEIIAFFAQEILPKAIKADV